VGIFIPAIFHLGGLKRIEKTQVGQVIPLPLVESSLTHPHIPLKERAIRSGRKVRDGVTHYSYGEGA